MNKSLIVISCLIIYQLSFCQLIKGKITDIQGNIIDLSYVEFKEANDINNIKEYLIVENGIFNYTLTKKYNNLVIEVSANDFNSEVKTINNLNSSEYEFKFVLLDQKKYELKEIILVSQKSDVIIKEDTLKYNVSNFRDGSERKIEDIIKKLPGISVNDKTGEIKYNGKSIETVTLDGDNMFGNNYTLGTKNISVDLIDQVQAIDNYSENALLKGIENGDKVSLNLKLKKGVTDYSGDIEFGLGLNKNNRFLTKSDLNLLQISKKYKSATFINYNNIGENNSPFDFFSGTPSLEELKNSKYELYKIIPETLFGNFIENERINNNKLIYTSYNNLFKINNRFNIKANILFLKDNINYTQINKTDNLINNSTILTSDEYSIQKKPTVFNSGINATYNLSKNSLLEYILKYNIEDIKTNSNILQNNITSIHSDLKSVKSVVFQDLIFTKKINNNHVLQSNIISSISKSPQELKLTSLFQNQIQKIEFDKKVLNGNIAILGKKKQFKYSFKFDYINENINLKSNNSNNESNNSNLIINQLSQTNNISYEKNNLLISSTIAFKNINQNLINQLDKKNNFFLESAFSLKYKISRISFISSKIANYQNSLFETQIYQNSIILNNRITSKNIANLNLQNNTFFNILYSNNNVYKKLLFEVSYDFNNNKGNFYSQFNIDENNTNILNVFSDFSNKSHNFKLNTVKYFSIISSTLKLNSNISTYEYYNYVNSLNIRKNNLTNFSNMFSINTALKSKINFENIFNYSLILNESTNSTFKNKNIINSFKSRYKFSKDIMLILKMETYIPNIKVFDNKYTLLDLDFSFIPKNKNYELYLTLKNILNEDSFSQIQQNDFSKSINQNNLLPRFFIINFLYKL